MSSEKLLKLVTYTNYLDFQIPVLKNNHKSDIEELVLSIQDSNRKPTDDESVVIIASFQRFIMRFLYKNTRNLQARVDVLNYCWEVILNCVPKWNPEKGSFSNYVISALQRSVKSKIHEVNGVRGTAYRDMLTLVSNGVYEEATSSESKFAHYKEMYQLNSRTSLNDVLKAAVTYTYPDDDDSVDDYEERLMSYDPKICDVVARRVDHHNEGPGGNSYDALLRSLYYNIDDDGGLKKLCFQLHLVDGMPVRDVRDKILEKYGRRVSPQTVLNWAQRYQRDAREFIRRSFPDKLSKFGLDSHSLDD